MRQHHVGTLPRAAIQAFLERPRADYRKANKWTDDEIARRLAALPVEPPIWDKLTRPQRICLLIGARKRRFLFCNDMGGGKTLIALALAAYFREAEGSECFLVLVPNRVNKDEWFREVAKHCPELTISLLPSNIKEKRAMLENPQSFILVDTYAGFTRACCDKKEVKVKKGSKKTKVVLKPIAKTVLAVTKMLDGVIADESSFLGTHDSLQTRLCKVMMRDKRRLFFPLTGTPFGRDPSLLWSQMRLVDEGYTLGETLGLFRAAFYSTSQNYWGGQEHSFKVTMEPKLHKFMAHRAVRWLIDDSELPELLEVKMVLRLPSSTQTYVDRAWQALRDAKGNYQLCKNAFIRMRQISSGFIGVKDDDTGARASIIFDDNPKLDYVVEKCMSASDKMVVFHDFKMSGKLLGKALSRAGVPYVLINGDTKDTTGTYAMFRDDPSCRVLLLNNQAGAFGLNLQAARYAAYYESPVSVIQRKQTMRRVRRPHSEHASVVVFDPIVRGTVDQDILDFHETGADLFAAVMQGQVGRRV